MKTLLLKYYIDCYLLINLKVFLRYPVCIFYLHRIDSLKAAGRLASVLFISAEPVVGPVPTLGEYLDGIDWVITGGESGPEARPADPDWFRSIRDQCDMHSVPFHFKQWGEFNENQERVGKKNAGRLLDGEAHDGVPVLVGGR